MKLSEFDYTLPKELIAQYPADKRSNSRMLVLNRQDKSIRDCLFYELPEIIDSSYFIVVNDSKVFKARMFAHRSTGGKVEIFLVRRLNDCTWLAFLRPSARVRQGEKLFFDETHYVIACDAPGSVERQIEFSSTDNERFIVKTYGQLPLPPYIKRDVSDEDLNRYQTIYAENIGSVAAPTAGLHFDETVLKKLNDKDIDIEKLTLHVGPGTFKPVLTETIEEHVIDPEFAVVSESTAQTINGYKKTGKKLLAVGTTSIRTLESIADTTGHISSYAGMVDLFIYPPYAYKTVDAMITNFHLPKTSLLMLVAAFCGHDFLFEAYRHAVSNKYRFYSYGDCMLIL